MIIKLLFEGQGELCYFEIDREKKKLIGFSNKTKGKLRPMPWKNLFDKGKEAYQDKVTEKLTDEEFKIVIAGAMQGLGYQPKSLEGIE